MKIPVSFIYLLLFVVACSTQASYPAETPEEEELSGRRQLLSSFWEKGKILIVYGDAVEQHAEAYLRLANTVAGRFPERIKPTVVASSAVDQAQMDTTASLLLGTELSNPLLKSLMSDLPFSFSKEGFEFGETLYKGEKDILSVLFYPMPQHEDTPLSWLTGSSDEAVLGFFSHSWRPGRWGIWSYEIYRENKRIVMGHFSETDWSFDKKLHFDFTEDELPLEESKHFIYNNRNALTEGALLEFQQDCEMRFARLDSFLNIPSDFPKINFQLYASSEAKGMQAQKSTRVHWDEKKMEVSVALGPEYEGDYLASENELICRKVLGKPNIIALEKGLANSFAPQWLRRGSRYWGLQLHASKNAPSLSEVLDNEAFTSDSEWIMGSMAGCFVQFLMEDWGREKFLKKYKNWNPQVEEIKKLNEKWNTWMDNNSIRKNIFSKKYPLPKKINGFNFTHEGYEVWNGYGSAQAAASLDYLKEMGTNAVAIVPYSYMRSPTQPSHIPIVASSGTENDESILRSIHDARARGMSILLKPQIWLGSGSWPGDVKMKSEADWQLFFKNYYQWIRHFAFLAEVYEIEMLSVGVEFAHATVEREKDWRLLIAKLRKLYSGKLTYSANWGDEFENITFWDDLDYIGFNCYYPLGDENKLSPEKLKIRFKQILKKGNKISEKYNKKIIFTEIGFRSIVAPWQNPHAAHQGRDFNAKDQAACYEAVLQVLKEEPNYIGIYWWKWPTILRDSYVKNRSFIPYRKPAETVVRQFYGE